MTSAAGDDPGVSLTVRPPRQQRSRAAWSRILDAGVALLEESGYDGFTIAAVCRQAKVAPPTVYARVDTKDGLFLAVYEHGMARLRTQQAVFVDDGRWLDLSPEELVATAVREVAAIFRRNAALLRSVVLISGVHAEVYRRGSAYSQELGQVFADRMLTVHGAIDHPEPRAAVLAAFNAVFSTLVLRVAYGPGFATSAAGDQESTESLVAITQRYLLRRSPGVEPDR